MPTHTGVDQRVRGYEANLHVRSIERHVLGFQAQAVATGLEQGAQDFRPNRTIRDFQHLGVGVG
ncbi:hypothetical protein D3C76_1829190 [compost metagenome]